LGLNPQKNDRRDTDYTKAQVGPWLQTNQGRWDPTICNKPKQPYYDPATQKNQRLSKIIPNNNVDVWILAANFRDTTLRKTEKNDASIVLLFKYKDVHVFLMGDATHIIEQEIVNNYRGATPAPGSLPLLKPPASKLVALKLGHHGSHTASSNYFIDEIQPQALFISADLNSTYGHPKAVTLAQIKTRTTLARGGPHTYVEYTRKGPTAGGRFDEVKTNDMIYSTLFEYNSQNQSSTGAPYHYFIGEDGSVELMTT